MQHLIKVLVNLEQLTQGEEAEAEVILVNQLEEVAQVVLE
tara:strand:+ start:515 stop:634 length:120 start_codon:yes stop_codon:yes gene_type:complete